MSAHLHIFIYGDVLCIIIIINLKIFIIIQSYSIYIEVHITSSMEPPTGLRTDLPCSQSFSVYYSIFTVLYIHMNKSSSSSLIYCSKNKEISLRGRTLSDGAKSARAAATAEPSVVNKKENGNRD